MLNPQRVELVRLRLGLSKKGFADCLGVDRKTIQRFEASGELSDELLDRLCSTSGYARGFFFQDDAELPNPDGVSFRSLRSMTAKVKNKALAAAGLAFEFDDWINERFNLPSGELPQYNNKSPVEAAALVRASWSMGERPIENMINLLEQKGIRVFSLSEETKHLDGYSFWRNEKPYVFLNTMKTAERTRFDAAHELGHLIMHKHTGSHHKTAEDEANAFASALLIPPNDLLAHLPRPRSLRELIDKKARWKVSAAALNYAVNRQGLLTDWRYRSNYIELNKLGYEPNPIERETSQIWKKVMTELWKDGLSLSHIAREHMYVAEKELSDLLFGIAAERSPIPRSGSSSLRVIK